MWLFTVYGFFSVVQSAEKRKGQKGPMMMIRSRERKELEFLIKNFSRLAGAEILVGTGTDYKYRIVITKRQWEIVSAIMTLEIDYSNFKDKAAEVWGKDKSYVSKLMQMWAIIRRVYGVKDLIESDRHEDTRDPADLPDELRKIHENF